MGSVGEIGAKIWESLVKEGIWVVESGELEVGGL